MFPFSLSRCSNNSVTRNSLWKWTMLWTYDSVSWLEDVKPDNKAMRVNVLVIQFHIWCAWSTLCCWWRVNSQKHKTMPFISKDWRSPGEEWVKTEEGWEKKKILECGRQGTQQENMDTTTRFVYHLSWSNQYNAFLSSSRHIWELWQLLHPLNREKGKIWIFV